MRRSKIIIKNSIWGIIQQIIICFISLFSRRVMIDAIGVQGVGLNGLLTNVVSMLSLADMGIGTAIIFHMYVPLAKNDKQKIGSLLNLYKQIYRWIACVITILGLCLIPFLPYIVKGTSYTKQYINLIYILFLIQTASTYLFTYKRSLLSADQKQYIISIYDMIFKIISLSGGMIILYFTKNLVYYLIFLIISTFINNLAISLKVDKEYPYIKTNTASLSKDEHKSIFSDVKNIFIGKISGTITNSTDNILISALVGTIETGLYSNYTIIINTLNAMMRQVSTGMSGSIGNLLASEDSDTIIDSLNTLNFAMFFIASFCSSCLLCLINPFITIAFGKGLLLSNLTVSICIINFYLTTVKIPLWNMLNVSGLFKYDKYISISGTTINLIVSFILGKKIGIDGILIGTTCTIVIQYILKIVLFYKKYLNKKYIHPLFEILKYFVISISESYIALYLTHKVNISNIYINFIICGIIAAIIPIIINLILFKNKKEINYVKKIIKKR